MRSLPWERGNPCGDGFWHVMHVMIESTVYIKVSEYDGEGRRSLFAAVCVCSSALSHIAQIRFLHHIARLGRGPELAERALAHAGGEVLVEVGNLRREPRDELLDLLADRVPIVRAGRGHRCEPMIAHRRPRLAFAEIDQRADDLEIIIKTNRGIAEAI